MPDKKKPLCATCRAVRDGKFVPNHLVHPKDGKPGLFDTHGQAVCPDCGALWQRERNVVRLVD